MPAADALTRADLSCGFVESRIESEDTNEYGFELEFNSQLLQESARSRTVTVHFADKDVGDQFLVKVRSDTPSRAPAARGRSSGCR